MEGVWKHLLRKSQPENLVFIGEERETGEFYPKMVGGQTSLVHDHAPFLSVHTISSRIIHYNMQPKALTELQVCKAQH